MLDEYIIQGRDECSNFRIDQADMYISDRMRENFGYVIKL